jgi:hypothetical protein
LFAVFSVFPPPSSRALVGWAGPAAEKQKKRRNGLREVVY